LQVDGLKRRADQHKSNVEYLTKEAAKAEEAKDYRLMNAEKDRAWHQGRDMDYCLTLADQIDKLAAALVTQEQIAQMWARSSKGEQARAEAAKAESAALREENEAAKATLEDEQAAHQDTLRLLTALRDRVTAMEGAESEETKRKLGTVVAMLREAAEAVPFFVRAQPVLRAIADGIEADAERRAALPKSENA
jgi:predicted ATPase